VRAAVAEALGHIPDPRAVESLSLATRDRDLNVRQAAIDSLAAQGSQSGGIGQRSQGGDSDATGGAR
jgi:HEAT repeat protein